MAKANTVNDNVLVMSDDPKAAARRVVQERKDDRK